MLKFQIFESQIILKFWEQENPWALKRYPQIGWSPIPE
jgi:hypothetical protein